jgi:hypothetical protein
MATKTKNLANKPQSRNSALFTQPEVRHRIHNRPPLIPILFVTNVVYTRTSQFFNTGFNIILIYMPVLHLFSIQTYKHNRPTVRIAVSHLMHTVFTGHIFHTFFVALNYKGWEIISFFAYIFPILSLSYKHQAAKFMII